MAGVDPDQHRGQAFQHRGIRQRPRVDGKEPRRAHQLGGQFLGLLVIAGDQHVAVRFPGQVPEMARGDILERGDDAHARPQLGLGLLRGRTAVGLPDHAYLGRLQRHAHRDQDLALASRHDLGDGRLLCTVRHAERHYLACRRRFCIGRAGKRGAARGQQLAQLGADAGRLIGAAAADHDRIARSGPTHGQPGTFSPGPADHGDGWLTHLVLSFLWSAVKSEHRPIAVPGRGCRAAAACRDLGLVHR